MDRTRSEKLKGGTDHASIPSEGLACPMCSKRSPGVVPWARRAASVLRVENEPSIVQNCPTSTRFVAGRPSKTVSAVLRRRSSRVLVTCRVASAHELEIALPPPRRRVHRAARLAQVGEHRAPGLLAVHEQAQGVAAAGGAALGAEPAVAQPEPEGVHHRRAAVDVAGDVAEGDPVRRGGRVAREGDPRRAVGAVVAEREREGEVPGRREVDRPRGSGGQRHAHHPGRRARNRRHGRAVAGHLQGVAALGEGLGPEVHQAQLKPCVDLHPARNVLRRRHVGAHTAVLRARVGAPARVAAPGVGEGEGVSGRAVARRLDAVHRGGVALDEGGVILDRASRGGEHQQGNEGVTAHGAPPRYHRARDSGALRARRGSPARPRRSRPRRRAARARSRTRTAGGSSAPCRASWARSPAPCGA